MTLEIIIARYGLTAVFLGAGLEGEAAVISAGFLAHQGLLPLSGVILVAVAGSFAADQIYFMLGRRFCDHRRVRRLLAAPTASKALAIFAKHPTGFILGFRFLYGIRIISPVAIGTSQISSARFVVLNLAAASVWGTLFSSLGYFFGKSLPGALGEFRSVEHVVITIVAAFLLVFLGMRIVRRILSIRRGRGVDNADGIPRQKPPTFR